MRRLYFGGTFNPIHHGHLIGSRAVAEAADFDCVTLIPSHLPPHKSKSADLAAADDRLEMCRLAVNGSDRFEVSDIELRREGPSYTLQTVRDLKERYPSPGPIHWLIGADTLPQLPTWHEPDQLLKEVQFVIMARPDSVIEWQQLPESLQSLRHFVVQAPQIDISATRIRQRVAERKSIQFLTPDSVGRYILQRGLYLSQ